MKLYASEHKIKDKGWARLGIFADQTEAENYCSSESDNHWPDWDQLQGERVVAIEDTGADSVWTRPGETVWEDSRHDCADLERGPAGSCHPDASGGEA